MNNETFLNDRDRIIYTVSDFNQAISGLLRQNLSLLWISGELSNFVSLNSGHWYFSLKDSHACVRCIMFKTQNACLDFHPKNGDQVLVLAKPGFYERRGDFQLVVECMESAGAGALRLAFEQLKARLASEGLFDSQHKKPVPPWPRTIGLITSPTGAAIRDILSILQNRFPLISVLVYPTVVQGSQASEQIANRLYLANRRCECDVLIVARGGGSFEDLAPFNEERMARAIHASSIPVISAVGHEIDFTISDFAADLRAPTPSAAAVLVSPDQEECWQALATYFERLVKSIRVQLESRWRELEHFSARLRHPKQSLQEYAKSINQLKQNLTRAVNGQLQKRQEELVSLTRALDTTSPLQTLARGYSLLMKADGSLIYSIDQTKVGEQITAKLASGTLLCYVSDKIISS